MKAWKVRKFFGDLVYDLRSRNLLPVVIMLAVGIVAVPFLISRSDPTELGSVSLGPTASAAATSPLAENAVVAYHPPGCATAKKRLNDLGLQEPVHPAVHRQRLQGRGALRALDRQVARCR